MEAIAGRLSFWIPIDRKQTGEQAVTREIYQEI